ncbi:MAG: sigma-70 family RNA polymerase sigma factor [Alphaproteobacteria bacterium]|nr:sigma-70 family RNA polymerase sigma factor [Alphaproteobacteria bacterium]
MNDRRRRFEQLVLPHLDAAHNLACWLCRSTVDAEDVVQEAMLRAFRAFDGFRGGEAKPWLLAIVRNCHYTAMGQKNKHRSVPLPADDDAGPVTEERDPEAATVDADTARRLHIAIAALPEEFRETLVLREMEEMSYREIAEITGAPIGTVMSRLARARALLRERWLEKETVQ